MKKNRDYLDGFSPVQFWTIMFLFACMVGFAVEGGLQ